MHPSNSLQPASFEDFEREARRGNVVAVSRTLSQKSTNPVEAFLSIAGEARYAFLLESVEGAEGVAKYSFIGAEPGMIVRGRGNKTFIDRNGSRETLLECVTDYLKRHFRERKLANPRGLAPLAGGAVGHLGYGAAKWFEPALNKMYGEETSDIDDALLMFYRTLLVFDHEERKIKIVSVVFTEEASSSQAGLRELYEDAVKQTERIESLLATSARACISSTPRGQLHHPETASVRSNWARKDFEEAVRSVKEHILAGDCYQVVLSQRFTKVVTKNLTDDPISIYRALRKSNPSPYMYFLKLGDESIIGASPEMLVRCRGTQLDYRPIAGTRRRGANEAEDLELAEEMRNDEKEVAEHMMLVDLGRNDLGRVAEFGSVKVEELMSVERYSKVQHLVSRLSARLRAGSDRFDALAACFPAGTVTGAPKVRAMEIIRQLEPESRGVYAGAVLYADYADNLDSCIAIRTIDLKQAEASVQAGAGIVADSIPEREYEETVHKAQALLRAIEMAEDENQPREN